MKNIMPNPRLKNKKYICLLIGMLGVHQDLCWMMSSFSWGGENSTPSSQAPYCSKSLGQFRNLLTPICLVNEPISHEIALTPSELDLLIQDAQDM